MIAVPYHPPAPWSDDELALVFNQVGRWINVMQRPAAAVYELHKAMPDKPVSEIAEMMLSVGAAMPELQFIPPAPLPEYPA